MHGSYHLRAKVWTPRHLSYVTERGAGGWRTAIEYATRDLPTKLARALACRAAVPQIQVLRKPPGYLPALGEYPQILERASKSGVPSYATVRTRHRRGAVVEE
jgi:hypothetical protein